MNSIFFLHTPGTFQVSPENISPTFTDTCIVSSQYKNLLKVCEKSTVVKILNNLKL